MTLKNIFIYPVKSMGGIELEAAKMQIHGLEHDRRWILVNSKGKFVTQRNDAALTQIHTAITDEFLVLKKEGQMDLQIPLVQSNTAIEEVKIWGDLSQGIDEGSEVSKWFKSALGIDCKLYKMAPNAIRRSSVPFRKGEKKVSFADSQPILITNETSLAELNSRLETPVPMSRFRANFVVEAPKPFEEDNWKSYTVGTTKFKVTKACGRCNVINIDQVTGETSKKKEPFETLSTYRFFNKNVNFGMRCKLENDTEEAIIIRVGDKVEVVE